ncbi:MAG TPA: L-threonylcarbamoyladenylate synthase [Nitrososphaeraceae archaeon]|nr:L-threonylcarbamoyladenylate synthase [Nitrososphaeraceae archaeon]
MKFKCGDDKAAENCANVVKGGGVIVYPTDTVYAIGCDPFNDEAVERIFIVKRRAPEKAMPVLCANLMDLEKIVEVSNRAKRLARSFWPGPLTIICPLSNRNISSRLTCDNSSLAVRIPANRCALSLLKISRYLVGTSANISGQQSIKNPSQINASSLTNFDALLDGGTLNKYSHSTIIRLDDDEALNIVRTGPITREHIVAALRSA